jgi:xanthine dehydrogenase accessory factor
MFNDRALAEKARQLEADHTPYALATVVRCKSPTSAQPGYKALVTAAGDIHGWIGGGCVQPAVIKTARQALLDGQPQLIRVSPVEDAHPEDDVAGFKSACYSGGSLDIFIEPMLSRPALLLLGSSEVAKSLATLAHFAGFTVTVASPAADEASFPWADQIIAGFDTDDARFSSAPLVVVATQGKGDQAALQAALGVDTFYRAFIASKRKADKLKQLLKDKGHDPRTVDAITAPAGLAIGATSPEEIAVSVLAGLVAARHAELAAPAEPLAQDVNARSADAAAASRQTRHTAPRPEPTESGCCGNKAAT